MTQTGGVLDGVRVVEMGVWVAGPSAAGIMADWGADVVKVEPPTGDPFRNLFATLGFDAALPNPPFALDNRGKRSVVLDLEREDARDVFERLLAGADVFVTNYRPGALDRLGLGPDAVAERHPRLVYASVSGYGLRGPDRDRPGYDVGAFWARTGIARQLAHIDEPPPAIRGGLGDHITGITALSGVLAALLERERTGRGRVVEVSLLRTGMYCLGWDLGIQLMLGRVGGASRRHRSQTPLINCYLSSDQRWFFLIGLEADRHFPGVARAIDRPDLLDDERFARASDRLRNREELIALFDEVFATRPLDEWAKRFDAEGVWWESVLAPADIVVDDHARAVGAFVEVAGNGTDPFEAVNAPVEFHGAAVTATAPVPRLGEHTAEVLRELGLDDAAIASLS